MIWGSTLASSIVNSSLGLNTFLVSPPMVKKISEVAFVTGQPLDYYSSCTPFVDYALLGDDILIIDKKVVNQYSRLLDRLSVTISFAKSIGSENGTIEFAKRGYPLNPYLKAKIIDYLREAVKPKKIHIFPKDLVFDGEREILERAVILNLMK
ncbi:hypothetical protein RDI58_010620 [Solanum bulbocastanum]|uniref:Uncharacterized protein n=1 Tax=Solanum bulbocastanum TaxID=147425 RepID=A0AAN8TR96_SOLBU